MRVEIYSDMVCPFCYIGKKRFEQALHNFPERHLVEVTYRSYELDPNAPENPDVSLHESLAEKYQMTVEKAKEMNDQVSEQAREVGLDFNLDRQKPANTVNAHRLSHFAKKQGKMNVFVSLVHKAYFTDEKDINDAETLINLAEEAGLDADAARNVLESDQFKDEVRADQHTGMQIGVQGVPFFVFNDKYAVSGAQPSEVFLEVLEKVYEEEKNEPKDKVASSSKETEYCDGDSCGVE